MKERSIRRLEQLEEEANRPCYEAEDDFDSLDGTKKPFTPVKPTGDYEDI